MKMAPIIAELRRRRRRIREPARSHRPALRPARCRRCSSRSSGFGEPDYSLDVGSGSHAQQTARVMERLEPVLLDERARSRARARRRQLDDGGRARRGEAAGSRSAHVEAGLRSFDRTMPEEINRVVTDQLATLLFTHSPEAAQTTWRREGVRRERDPLRRQHDDRHARRTARSDRGRAARAAAWG